MTRARGFILLLGLLLLGGCGGNYKGFHGDAMYTGAVPQLIITPAPPLKPLGAGSVWAGVNTDTNLRATANLDYVIYGDPAETGPVRRHGHVFVAGFSSIDSGWDFVPESFPRSNEVSLETVRINGQDWTEHLMYVDGAGDWPSAVWEANGRPTPERWIAKRWSRTYFSTTRVVVEYREPMPDCVDLRYGTRLLGGGVAFSGATSDCGGLIRDFQKRADQAFTIMSARGAERVALTGLNAGGALLERPQSRPDMAKLVGTARMRSVLKAWGDD